MDKWLWAARFFKTRALAVKACDMGRITSNGQTAKPARDVRVGDRLALKPATLRSKSSASAKYAVPPPSHRPSTAKAKPAATVAASSSKTAN